MKAVLICQPHAANAVPPDSALRFAVEDLETRQPDTHIRDAESDGRLGLDHGVGHFRPLSITRQRHLLVYHYIAMSHEGLCQVF